MTLWRVIARSNTFWASEHDANDDGEIEIAIDLFRLRPCWEYEYKVYVRLAKKVLFVPLSGGAFVRAPPPPIF
jgi:hypothetical protein